MKRTISLTLILWGSFFIVNAQTSIDKLLSNAKIARYRDSTTGFLNSRSFEKISVKRYFELQQNESAYLYFDEEEALLLITGRFKSLLLDLHKRKTKFYKAINFRSIDRKDKEAKKIYKPLKYFHYDTLTLTLISCLKNNEGYIKENIKSADLNQEEKDFLILLTDYYLSITDFCNIDQEQKTISGANLYLKNHPLSTNNEFVKKYIDIEFSPGKWGCGVYYNMGVLAHSNNLNKHFSNTMFISISFDANYRRFDLTSGIGGIISGKLKSNFYHDTLWQKNDKYYSFIGSLTLAYHIIETKKINVSPFVGVRYYSVQGENKNDSLYYDNIFLDSQNSLTYGINIDYKFGYGTCKSVYLNRRGGYQERIFADLRLSIGYQNPKFDAIVPNLKGGLWYIAAGIGFNSYAPKRVIKK